MGHSDGSVASKYGSGYSLDVMRDALVKVWKINDQARDYQQQSHISVVYLWTL